MPATRLRVPSARVARIARLASALQRWSIGAPARWTTASRPSSAAAGAGPSSMFQATASTPSKRERARAGSRASTVTSLPCARSSRTSREPTSPVAPVIVTRAALMGSDAPVGERRSRLRRREHVAVREAHLAFGERGAALAGLLGDGRSDGRGDIAVEDRGDDVVLAQLVLL